MRNEMASFFEDPRFKSSLAKYEDMVKSHVPAYFEANELTDIAEYYASLERDKDADEVVRFGLSIHPDDIDLLIFQSRSLALRGDTKGARHVMSLITDQNDREVKFLLFDILSEEKRYGEADQVLEDLARDEDYSVDVILDVMQTYVDNEEIANAKDWYAELGKRYDVSSLIHDNKRYRSILCDYYLTVRDNEHCLPLLLEMVDESPYNIGLWNDLTRCYIDMNELEKAHEAVDFSLAIDDKNADAILLKAMCFEFGGNLKESNRLKEKVIEMGTRFPFVNLQLIKTYLNMREYEQAGKQVDRVEEELKTRHAQLAERHRYLLEGYKAVVMAWRQDFEEAHRLIDYLMDVNEIDPETHLAAGHVALLEDDLYHAREQFRIVLEQSEEEDDDYEALMECAGLLFDNRDLEGAAEFYKKMIIRYPDDCKPTLYIALYCFAYQRDIRMFYHCYARIRRDMPELYQQFGSLSLFPDKNFDNLLLGVRDAIEKGDIDIDKYLPTPDF